jgi:hypothetical protein
MVFDEALRALTMPEASIAACYGRPVFNELARDGALMHHRRQPGTREETMQRLLRTSLALPLALLASAAAAQSHPARPVRLIIPFPPGGSNDIVGRMIAAQFGDRLGQQVVADNRGGAGGTPEEFAQPIKIQLAFYAKLIRDAGIKAE